MNVFNFRILTLYNYKSLVPPRLYSSRVKPVKSLFFITIVHHSQLLQLFFLRRTSTLKNTGKPPRTMTCRILSGWTVASAQLQRGTLQFPIWMTISSLVLLFLHPQLSVYTPAQFGKSCSSCSVTIQTTCGAITKLVSPPDIVYQLIFAFVFYFIVESFIYFRVLFSLFKLENSIIVSKVIKKNGGFYGSFKN